MNTNASVQNNLPVQLTSYIGRENEINDLVELIKHTRLLTLTGTGGVGKTRLSLQFASAVLQYHIDGIWLIELAPVQTPGQVTHRLSAIIGINESGDLSGWDLIHTYFQNKSSLLIMDNCEHLIHKDHDFAAHIEGLLCHCPDLKILATSREPLGIAGETIYRVLPLPLPVLEKPFNLPDLTHYDSFNLFIQRARDYNNRFELNDETADDIVNICHLLDGIPLAIELAAARITMFSTYEIAKDLEVSSRLLSRGSKTASPRHQTLQASLNWSYGLLNDQEKVLFRRLAVFSGKFTLSDVENICCDEFNLNNWNHNKANSEHDLNSIAILDIVSNLVDKSLLNVTADNKYSYQLLNPIFLFALQKLKESGEENLYRNRHLDYYHEVLKNDPLDNPRSDMSEILERIDLEIDNLRTALFWSIQSGNIKTGLSLACELGEFWWRQGYTLEGLEWIEQLVQLWETKDNLHARGLIQAARLLRARGDYERSKTLCNDALIICKQQNDSKGIASAISILGTIELFYGNREKALQLLEESTHIFRQIDDQWHIAANLLYIGDTLTRSGKTERSKAVFEESLSLFRTYKDKWGTAFATGGLGYIAQLSKNYQEAYQFHYEAVRLHMEMDNKLDISYALEALAILASALKAYEKAAMIWGFTNHLRESIHAKLPLSYHDDYRILLDHAKKALGEDKFATLMDHGRQLDLDQLRALILDPLQEYFIVTENNIDHSKVLSHGVKTDYNLTEREIEILCLVAQGLTDARVAEVLFISPRTVSKHLQSIYRKINVNSRSAATRFAIENQVL